MYPNKIILKKTCYKSTNSVREMLLKLSESEIDNSKVKINSLYENFKIKCEQCRRNSSIDTIYCNSSKTSKYYKSLINCDLNGFNDAGLLNNITSIEILISRHNFHRKNLNPEKYNDYQTSQSNRICRLSQFSRVSQASRLSQVSRLSVSCKSYDSYDYNVDNLKCSKKNIVFNNKIKYNENYDLFLKEEDKKRKNIETNLNRLIIIVNKIKRNSIKSQSPKKMTIKSSNYSFSTECIVDNNRQRRGSKSLINLWKSEGGQYDDLSKSKKFSRLHNEYFFQNMSLKVDNNIYLSKSIEPIKEDYNQLNLLSFKNIFDTQDYNVDNIISRTNKMNRLQSNDYIDFNDLRNSKLISYEDIFDKR